jgi:hypothetical protein
MPSNTVRDSISFFHLFTGLQSDVLPMRTIYLAHLLVLGLIIIIIITNIIKV